MIDHYKILGIKNCSTKEEIKKAFKKLALKHHPDKGGETAYFQKLNDSYQFLMDDVKRSAYDMSFSSKTSETIYDAYGNKISLNIEIILNLTLEQVYNGWKCPNFEYTTNRGVDTVNIELSYTIMSGMVLKFLGKGNTNNSHRGDLFVKIQISDPKFKKNSLKDITTILEVDYIRATVGGTIRIDNFIRKETVSFYVPSNVKEGSIIRSNERLGAGELNDRGYVYGIVKLVYPTLNKVTKKSLDMISEYIQTQEYENYFKYK